MEILGKLFGSPARVKIMRLFLLNPDIGFDTATIAVRTKVSSKTARGELASLASIKFIKKRTVIKEGKTKSKRVPGWVFNPDFKYRRHIQDLLVDGSFLQKDELMKRFQSVGKIKLMLISGVFLHEKDSRADILIVGDNLKKNLIEQTVKNLEAEIGKELSYAMFETQEFIYRINMYDKLVRDILDYPHERLIDSREFSTHALKKA